MTQLELTCPSCEQILVLDAGFAGGVCRCSECGMLMTVPHDPLPETREAQPRPNRPQKPGECTSPEAVLAEAVLAVENDEAVAPRASSRKISGARASRIVSRGSTPDPGSLERGRYRTAVIYAAVLSILVLVTVVCIVGIRSFVQKQAKIATDLKYAPKIEVEFNYDPEANPFSLDKPNVLGIQLSKRTVVVVDASSSSRPWLGLVKDAIMAGTDFETRAVSVQLIIAASDGLVRFPEQPAPLRDLPRGEMRGFLNGILALGQTNIDQAIQRALGSRPVQLLLVTGSKPTPEQTIMIRALLKNASSTRFDVALVGIQATELLSLSKRYGGQYATMTSQRLRAWRYETN